MMVGRELVLVGRKLTVFQWCTQLKEPELLLHGRRRHNLRVLFATLALPRRRHCSCGGLRRRVRSARAHPHANSMQAISECEGPRGRAQLQTCAAGPPRA